MNTAARTYNPYPSIKAPLREDDAIAALIHLYLELQLPPQSAWRAAQADHRAAIRETSDVGRCNVNRGETP